MGAVRVIEAIPSDLAFVVLVMQQLLNLSTLFTSAITIRARETANNVCSRCLAVLLAGGEEPLDLHSSSERRAQLPLRMGGLGLSSAREHRQAAYWASWADTVGALRKCHPGTLANLMRPFTDLALPGTPPSAREAEQAAQSLRLRGFQAPSWASLLGGTDGANPAKEEDSSL
ncbi:unnamed protein product, partial [Symbiodinium microadriaticum]